MTRQPDIPHPAGAELEDFVERAFGGSTQQLLQHAISGPTSSREELAAVRRWMEEQENKS